MRTPSPRTGAHEPRERAALVGLFTGSSRSFDPEHSLDELAGLAAAAGADVALRVLQDRPRPDPATFLGSGKVTSLALMCDEARVDTVIFDNELTPAQLRNLETALDRKVVDRTQLILDIFARRARTREGKLQVELAQLNYLLPRLVGSSHGAVAARRRYRHARPGRDQARNGPAANPAPDRHPFRMRSTSSAGAARSSAIAVTRPPCRPWRSSATPTRARRRCSTC